MKIPWRATLVGALTLMVTLSACGSSGGGGGGGGGGDEFPESAKATSDDPEGTVFPLQEGRYRLSYRAPGCTDIVIQITGADGAVVYDQHPRAFTSFVNDVPAGEYTVAVTTDCETWTINLDKF